MASLIVAVALAALALLAVGPSRCVREMTGYWMLLRSAPRLLAGVILCATILPLLAGDYVDLKRYGAFLAASSLAFVSMLMLTSRFEVVSTRGLRFVTTYSPMLLAAVLLVFSAAAGILVLENVPHVSDEVAYQFQAKALSTGRLYMSAPSPPEFFTFTHTMVDDGRWYGIMNPGWPLVLSIGYLVSAPWLVNPVLVALTLVLLFRFYREAGYGDLETRMAVFLVALSPFVLFLSGTYMAHAANLLFFVLFAWAWARMLSSGQRRWALLAGLALGFNLLVRPIDSVAAAAPFGVLLVARAARNRRWIQHMAIAGGAASLFVLLTALYNRELTGDPFTVPMTEYFLRRNPGEKFGLGFGSDMGTSLHGPEWPGYYPGDALRVTAHRLLQLVEDVNGLPLVMLAAILFPFTRKARPWGTWHTVMIGTFFSLIAVYLLHFYHGIAYGSRHYYLAVPALAMLLARPLARWIQSDDSATRQLAVAASVALVLATVVFPYPELVRDYGERYRGATGAVRDAVRSRQLHGAVVFVDTRDWGWKSAFPLNDYPLERNDVLFARDMGERNPDLLEYFPGRRVHRLRVDAEGRVLIAP